MAISTTKTSGGIYPPHPRVAVGAVVFHEERVLLVLRNHPPSEKKWAIPGGRVHLGETLQHAAEREVMEETGLTIKAGDPIYTFDVIDHDEHGKVRFHYVIVDLSAQYIEGTPRGGDDALDAKWVAADELQQLDVAGPTVMLLEELFGFGI